MSRRAGGAQRQTARQTARCHPRGLPSFHHGLTAEPTRAAGRRRQQRPRELERGPDDPDAQTLLLWYPAATHTDDYIRSAVKIEAGAKSALDPHTAASVWPYIADDLPRLDLRVPNVTTVGAERTFWDKIILHGLRQWYDRRGVLRHGGQRVSRHYYDPHQLMRDERAAQWLTNKVRLILARRK